MVEKDASIEDLMKILEKGDISSQFRAAEELGKRGKEALPSLIGALKDSQPNIRWRAAIAISRIGAPAVDDIIEMLNSNGVAVNSAAMWALAEIGDERAVSALSQVMCGNFPECSQVLAAAALLKLDNPEGVALVEQAIKKKGKYFADAVKEAYPKE